MSTLCYSALLIYSLAVVQLSHGSCNDYDILGSNPPCCDGKVARKTAPWKFPSSQSPAGGPAAYPDAVVCTFYISCNCLKCRKGTTVAACCTESSSQPPPSNEYIILYNPVDLEYIIFSRNETIDNYNQFIGRSNLRIANGTETSGSISVIDDMGCWTNIMQVVNMGMMMYNGANLNGFLYAI